MARIGGFILPLLKVVDTLAEALAAVGAGESSAVGGQR
jgi:hypothetical protein